MGKEVVLSIDFKVKFLYGSILEGTIITNSKKQKTHKNSEKEKRRMENYV
jgi:hypothetical protein